MKILVVFTGGTIGSTKDEYIAPDEKKPYRLIEEFRERGTSDADFEYAAPYTILSENLSGTNLRLLCGCVREALEKDYDGIIVTHGTDTLQYSAAALAYALGHIELPVLLVSSNYVLEDARANGLDNFCRAVDFIANRRGTGVFVSYRNMDGKVYIHRGTRVLPHLPYSDEVFSVAGQYYGVYDAGAYQKNPAYQSAREQGDRLEPPLMDKSNVLRIIPYPGMSYPKLDKEVAAVLMDSYHSGTICSESKELKEFLADAGKYDIPVFLTGASADTYYESVKGWRDSGITVLPQASNIAMYVKLWMLAAQGQTVKEISKRMLQSVAEEFTQVEKF